MLNNIWKGSYILFMYFFRSFLMIFLYALIKLKRNLLLSPPPKNTPSSPCSRNIQLLKRKSGSKKENENSPLKTAHRKFNLEATKRRKTAHLKTSARPIDTNVRWIPNLVTCGGLATFDRTYGSRAVDRKLAGPVPGA